MKKRMIFILTLIIIIVMLLGCSNKSLEKSEESSTNKETYDPFETEKNSDEETSTEALGSITHGTLALKNGEATGNEIIYKGGELQLDYFITADGIAKKSGFLIYVDGIPQPYKIELDGKDMDYQYMHELELEEGEETDFKFIFTPVTGKKGETLPITIASITYPSYAPDVVETSSYGYAHQILEGTYSIVFEQDTDEFEALELKPKVCLSNVEISSTVFTNEEKEKYNNGFNTFDFEKQVYSKLYIDDEDMKLASSKDINSKDKIHIRYEITGHPGLKYKSIFYINHQPISSQDTYYFKTDLQKGNISVIELDLDISKLDGNGTFYIVSVPCNANDYPDDAVRLIKYRSILLYDAQNINITDGTKENHEEVSTGDSDTSVQQSDNQNIKSEEIKLNETEDMIEGLYYAGEDNLFLLADKLYLYNINKKAVVTEAERQPGLSSMKVQKLEEGFAVVGTTGEEKEEVSAWGAADGEKIKSYNMECTFYDKNLKKTDTFDIVKQMGIDVLNSSEVAVSTDGSKIVCIGQNGLYIYDRNKNKKTCIVNTVNNENSEIRNMTFTNIAFADNSQKITFLSQNLGADPDENQQSESAYGIVNADGTGLVSYPGEDLAKLDAYKDTALMSQDIPLKGASGEAWVYYCIKQKLTKYTLEEKSESKNVWGSDTGQYFATSVRKDGEGWLIRIYDMNSGIKVYEKLYAFENTDNYKEPYIRLFDTEKKILLFFRPMQDEIQSKLIMAEF